MPGGPVVLGVSATIEKIFGRYPTKLHLFSFYFFVGGGLLKSLVQAYLELTM